MATITSTLESIFADAILPSLGAAFPWLGAALKIPVIGYILKSAINGGANWLIKNGVIEIKIGLIDMLDTASQAKWAAEVTILKAIKQGGLSAAQQAAYDQALANLVNTHGGIVSA